MKYEKNIIEKQNDTLLIWEIFGGPMMYIIGVIVIIGIVIGIFKVRSYFNGREERALNNSREKAVVSYMNKYPDVFKDVHETWNESNLYYARTKDGIFKIRFVETRIYEVVFTSNTGQQQVLYRE